MPRRCKRPTIIVTGFARTGTSAMMRMLHAGGIPVIAMDGKGIVNAFNPHGNFEILGVIKEMKRHGPFWSAGKAIKIVTPHLVRCCPVDYPLKVIFMLRDLNEVIASLSAARQAWEIDPFTATVAARKLLEENDVPVHYVNFRDLLAYPKSTAIAVADFLELALDIDKMVSAVDPNARSRIQDTDEAKMQRRVINMTSSDFRVYHGKQHDVMWRTEEDEKEDK